MQRSELLTVSTAILSPYDSIADSAHLNISQILISEKVFGEKESSK